MQVVETSVFTRRIIKLLSDEDYRLLQHTLIANPACGDVIRGGGGLRKMRWAASGRGKRGGMRVIYYWAATNQTILMLLAYAKNEQDDLSADELKMLRKLVEEFK